ncbi:ras association domain-containing protein 7b [Tachysurus fulvidraco]|uniref:ras association domain-containing protein 7b n=1 Tax=Tachysurus fulvidraco TaxID=1234273 RepID=UPI000F4E5F21|nr:ras association domain-containing protein 7b [Tachysurus fulvidraco]XP_026992714.1 ras association domain-containing protein 7b [Tachysurus fulvidraco]XP_047657189.1 ras association domain-containing protein 7b [Tachysurus fulvidraco]
MELKVWVDGVQRVVCGLSEETSCQDVVIALAQAIGQTGRFVLVQKLRDKERQLVANERPLEALAKLGQLSSEVQFILRRTGPTSSEGSDLDRVPSLPKLLEPELPKSKVPKKAHSFNLGPSTSSQAFVKQPQNVPKDSPELRVPYGPPGSSHAQSGPSKEEVFRQILQQQSRLQDLQAHLEALDKQVWVLEQPSPPSFSPDLIEEINYLEDKFRQNEAELAHGEYWESEYHVEVQKEQTILKQLREFNIAIDEHNRRIHETETQTGRLEHEVQLQENRKNGMHHTQANVEHSLGQIREQLDMVQHQEYELNSSVLETEKDLKMAEELLQAKSRELDELNKELRQCNLQQFIQQAGGPAPQLSVPADDPELAYLMPDGQSDEDSNHSVLEFNPRTTAKQILGNPRSLQNPLVSSLHPEVLQSREVSWR